MKLIDYLVLAGFSMAVLFAVFWIARRKKQGITGCGSCPYQAGCNQCCDNRKRNF